MPKLDDQDRDPLEVLAAEFMERQRKGEHPAISEYTAQYPELAAEIEELLPAVAAVERIKTQRESSESGPASLGTVRLERLGDFSILGEIGRGGMGIVYEAFQ
jgi:eukaryotic-like serine/threonine-protein kinase